MPSFSHVLPNAPPQPDAPERTTGEGEEDEDEEEEEELNETEKGPWSLTWSP